MPERTPVGKPVGSKRANRAAPSGYGADSRAYPDDYAILKQQFPAWAERKKPKEANEGGRWKGGQIQVNPASLVTEVKNRAKDSLGLDRYPHLVIPRKPPQVEVPSPRTLGGTKFGATDPQHAYVATVLSPDERSIKGESMASLSGVEPDRVASDVINQMGGGAYEHNGRVIYANSVESRTLLHELGHYKQDLQGFTEKTINRKLLEYHNIVTVEQDHEKTKDIKERWVRLSYSGNPKVFKRADWDKKLPDFARLEGYYLLQRLASPREQLALRQIDEKLKKDGPLYTVKMRSYLLSELAREYFATSKVKNF